MEPNSVCNHTSDLQNQIQRGAEKQGDALSPFLLYHVPRNTRTITDTKTIQIGNKKLKLDNFADGFSRTLLLRMEHFDECSILHLNVQKLKRIGKTVATTVRYR